MPKFYLCCSLTCSPLLSLDVTFMTELSTVIYCARLCPYQSLYVFIMMAELLDFPNIKKATPHIYTLINGLINLLSKSEIRRGQQTSVKTITITDYVRTLVSDSALWCWLRLCPLCAKRPVVTCLADSRVLRKAYCKILARNWGRFVFVTFLYYIS
jgi:hypothetical protein